MSNNEKIPKNDCGPSEFQKKYSTTKITDFFQKVSTNALTQPNTPSCASISSKNDENLKCMNSDSPPIKSNNSSLSVEFNQLDKADSPPLNFISANASVSLGVPLSHPKISPTHIKRRDAQIAGNRIFSSPKTFGTIQDPPNTTEASLIKSNDDVTKEEVNFVTSCDTSRVSPSSVPSTLTTPYINSNNKNNSSIIPRSDMLSNPLNLPTAFLPLSPVSEQLVNSAPVADLLKLLQHPSASSFEREMASVFQKLSNEISGSVEGLKHLRIKSEDLRAYYHTKCSLSLNSHLLEEIASHDSSMRPGPMSFIAILAALQQPSSGTHERALSDELIFFYSVHVKLGCPNSQANLHRRLVIAITFLQHQYDQALAKDAINPKSSLDYTINTANNTIIKEDLKISSSPSPTVITNSELNHKEFQKLTSFNSVDSVMRDLESESSPAAEAFDQILGIASSLLMGNISFSDYSSIIQNLLSTIVTALVRIGFLQEEVEAYITTMITKSLRITSPHTEQYVMDSIIAMTTANTRKSKLLPRPQSRRSSRRSLASSTSQENVLTNSSNLITEKNLSPGIDISVSSSAFSDVTSTGDECKVISHHETLPSPTFTTSNSVSSSNPSNPVTLQLDTEVLPTITSMDITNTVAISEFPSVLVPCEEPTILPNDSSKSFSIVDPSHQTAMEAAWWEGWKEEPLHETLPSSSPPSLTSIATSSFSPPHQEALSLLSGRCGRRRKRSSFQ